LPTPGARKARARRDSPERPAYLRWLVFMAVNLYGADLRLYYPQRYTTEESGARGVKQAALAHSTPSSPSSTRPSATQFLVSDSFSAADPYLLMLAHWHPDPGPVRPPRQYCPRLRRHPQARLRQGRQQVSPHLVKAAFSRPSRGFPPLRGRVIPAERAAARERRDLDGAFHRGLSLVADPGSDLAVRPG
jgi:glutathione S-transferase